MPDDRVHVWVQRFKDRKHLMLQWLDPDTGKRKSKSAETDDEDKAEQARADLEYELNHGKYQEASRMSWERFRELFEQEYVAPTRPATRENYRHVLDAFERVCSPRGLRTITERTVSAFAVGLRKAKLKGGREGMQPITVKVYLQFLHTALNWAVEQGLLPRCPKFPSVKVPKKKPRPVPAESFERMLAKAPDEEMRVFLLCGWLAGLRISEGMALEWEETREAPYLDFDRDRIWLPAEFAKGVEDQWIPLDPALKGALQGLPRCGRKVFRLISARTGERMTRGGMSMRVGNLARKAGVKLSMHATRRGFLCRYAEKVPAQVLQRLARHSDIKTTMDYYANVDEAVEEAVLGAKRNRLRNTPPTEGAACPEAVDVRGVETSTNVDQAL
jgi:integrase